LKYLLDTCVISELIKSKPNENVLNWISSIDESDLFLSVLTIGEIQKGISKLETNDRKKLLHEWVEKQLVPRFIDRLLEINTAIAKEWGNLCGEAKKKGINLPVIDSLLSASARYHKLIVATRNIDDFKKCSAKIINPWDF
jgi:predicted nucleic acid-binding protein